MTHPTPPEGPTALPRVLGPWTAASILIGSIIGSGVFVKPGEIARALPSPGWILACWVAAGALALIGSLVFAELGSYYPNAGGQYTFLREAFGDVTAFLFGWTNLVIINSASIAALAIKAAEFGTYLLPPAWRPPMDGAGLKLIAVAMIAGLTAVNLVGVRSGALVQNVLTIAKLAAICLVITAIFLPSRTNWQHFSPFWEIRGAPASRELLDGFKTAFLAIFWAYDGWYLLSFSCGEIHRPRRNIPLGFVLGILVVIAVYLAVNVAYLAIMPLGDMVHYTEGGGVAAEATLRAFGAVGLTILSAGIVCSTLGAGNGNMLTGPRLTYAMSRDRLFFPGFERIDPRFLTPARAIWLQGLVGAACVYVGTFRQLTDYVVFAAWTFYLLTVLSIFWLRPRHRHLADVFRCPWHPLLPAVFVAFACAFVSYNLWDSIVNVAAYFSGDAAGATEPGANTVYAALIILAGLPVYRLVKLTCRRGPVA